jgi:hypothetical protein
MKRSNQTNFFDEGNERERGQNKKRRGTFSSKTNAKKKIPQHNTTHYNMI